MIKSTEHIYSLLAPLLPATQVRFATLEKEIPLPFIIFDLQNLGGEDIGPSTWESHSERLYYRYEIFIFSDEITEAHDIMNSMIDTLQANDIDINNIDFQQAQDNENPAAITMSIGHWHKRK